MSVGGTDQNSPALAYNVFSLAMTRGTEESSTTSLYDYTLISLGSISLLLLISTDQSYETTTGNRYKVELLLQNVGLLSMDS